MDMEIKVGKRDKDFLDRMKLFEWYDKNKVERKKVLVVGAGALGNEVGKNLVMSGYKNITIVDMDYIVHSNLSRCILFRKRDADMKRYKSEVMAERLKEINEEINVDYFVGSIQEFDDIKSHTLILGCLDNIAARIHLNSMAYYHRIPYVDGATHGRIGKVQVVIPPVTSCLECGMNITHSKIVEKRYSCTGKDVKFFEPNMPSDINTTSIIAGIQVQEALKITHGMDNYIKNIFYYDGNRNYAEVLELPINPDCPNHF